MSPVFSNTRRVEKMAVVTLDISEFRTLYPQFADSVTYPDTEITAQFDIACTLINNTEQS